MKSFITGCLVFLMALAGGVLPDCGLVRADDNSANSSGEGTGNDDAAGDSGDDGAEDSADDSQDDSVQEEEGVEDSEEEAGDEAEDEDVDEGGEDDRDIDAMEDDADRDDDTELSDAGSSSNAATRRFSLDGLAPTSDGGIGRSLGIVDTMAVLADQEEQLLGNWKVLFNEFPDTRPSNPGSAQKIALPAEPLPRYRSGDTYVYSNGTWERVVSTNGRSVKWVNHRGNHSSGSVDFTYKRSKWQTAKRRGTRRFQQTEYLFSQSTQSLWPLVTGNKTRFDEFGNWIDSHGVDHVYDAFWRCEVEGAERILVAAGEFDSWRITCARYSDSISYPQSRAREYRSYLYAPALSHWVAELRDNQGYRPDSRKELAAVMPDLLLFTGDDQDVLQLQEQFQDVLENLGSGRSDIWMTRSGAASSTLTPVATYLREDGTYCRQYIQYIENREFSSTYAGMACRGTDQLWRISRR